jgi:hypothetical protein
MQTLTEVEVVLIVVVIIHCWCSHNPLHEQLLEELGVGGGVLSVAHTHDPPYEQWLRGMEYMHE